MPQLAGDDLWVLPDQVGVFIDECALLKAHSAALAEASGYDEDYILARLRNIAHAADRARQLGGGVLVW